MKTIYAILLLFMSPCLQADQVFSAQLPECAAKLEWRSVEADTVVVRSDCRLSLASLAQLLDQGLRTLFPEPPLPIHGIYLGRLMDYPEWSHDLANAAANSSAWNAKRGRPSKAGESDNQRVRMLLNGPAYPESLQALFASYQLAACVGDVEKVLVFKAKDIWPDNTKRPKRISAEARLPVDAQVWLSLQPLSAVCAGR